MTTDYHFRYAEIAEALLQALRGDAFYRCLEEASDADAMRRYHDYSMLEARTWGELTLPEDDALGAAVWSRPLPLVRQAEMDAAKQVFLRRHMNPDCLDRYTAMGNYMSGKAGPLVAPKSWYLSILAVSPTQQNRGLGAKLVRPVLERADQAGVPTYLETFTPRNEIFYRRLGYRVRGRFHEPTSGGNYALMVRVPGGTSA